MGQAYCDAHQQRAETAKKIGENTAKVGDVIDAVVTPEPIDLIPFAGIVNKANKARKATKLLRKGIDLSKNAKKMSVADIEKALGVGKDWHKVREKQKILRQFKKELKGAKNADFYIDKKTKEILLKGNKNDIWVKTGIIVE